MAPSAVWIYFKKVNDGSNVECLECGKQFKYNNSTSSLSKHLKTAHAIESNPSNRIRKRQLNDEESDDENNSVSQPKQSRQAHLSETPNTLVSGSSSASSSKTNLSNQPFIQGPIDRCISNAASFAEGGHRNNDVTTALMYMIAVDNLPLCTPEKPGFRMFVKKLQPLYNPPSEPTVTKRMKSKYEELQTKVRKELQEADSVCLTTDIWTHQHTMRSYLGVTVHYLKGYEMVSYELGAYYLKDRKTIAILRLKLREICNEWQIDDDKISAILSDGGANIKGAIKDEFGELKHISCFGHVINNIGQNLIEVNSTKPASESEDNEMLLPDNEHDSDTEDFPIEDSQKSSLRNLLVKVKKTVKFFRCSEIASRELETLQEQSGCKPALKLIQEVKTRWNSCYEMLDRFINLADYVSRALLKVQRDKSSRSKPPDILSGDDLDALIEVRDMLRPLWTVTHEVSADKHVTLSKCIPLITGLKRATDKLLPTTLIGQQLKKKLIIEIKQKFTNIESVKSFSIATLLDPRFKKLAFQSMTNSARAVTTVGDLLKKEIQLSKSVAIANENEQTPDYQPSSSDNDLWDFLDDAVQQNNQYNDSDEAGGLPIELRQFINRPTVARQSNSDPIVIWRSLEHEYPHLSRIAKKYLTIVATSTPCERLFSHTGLIANQLRSRLTPDHLNMLLFLRSVPQNMW